MDLFGFDIPLWMILTLCCFILSYLYATWTFDVFDKMGFPYVKPLPIFGSMLSLAKEPLAETDTRILSLYPDRTYGIFFGRMPVLKTFDRDLIKSIAITHFSKFTDRPLTFGFTGSPVTNDNLLELHGERWKNARSIVTPIFSSGKLKQMYPAMMNCTDKLIARLQSTNGEPLLIKDYVGAFTMDVIASTAFGLDIGTQDESGSTEHLFVAHAGTFFGVPRRKTRYETLKSGSMSVAMALVPVFVLATIYKLTGFSLTDSESEDYFEDLTSRLLSEEGQSASQEKNTFVRMCADKLVDPATLPADQVRRTKKNVLWSPKGLTRNEIVGNASVFLIAGYETTSTAIQFFLYCMVTYPEIQEQLYEEVMELCGDDEEVTYEQINKLPYMERCLNESLRMFPPITMAPRIVTEEATINGVHYPKGMGVMFSIYALHHDPEYWPEPEKFNPDRFLPENKTPEQQYSWLPFGIGNRNCVGMRLAMLEVKLAIYKLTKEFRFEKTENTTKPSEMEFEKGRGLPSLQATKPIEFRAISRQ